MCSIILKSFLKYFPFFNNQLIYSLPYCLTIITIVDNDGDEIIPPTDFLVERKRPVKS